MKAHWLFAAVASFAQVGAPPEFQSDAAFQKSGAARSADGTTHASAEQTRIHAELVNRLRKLPGHEAGIRLLDGKLLSAAETLFRKQQQPIGVAAAQFLSGKVEAGSRGFLDVAGQAPGDAKLLPFLGETIGAAPALLDPMVAAIRVIVGANPQHAEGHYYLARALQRRSGFSADEVVAELRAASTLDRTDTRALLELGRFLTETGKRAEAIAALEAVLDRDPSIAAAHFRLVSLYRANGQPEKAAAHLASFRKLQP
ncbi:MAG: tetratricopeptide repeat protein [Acidobacteria bacterium]|nr:tetratricopeptide repeat protein [Acidobacteriota bacterium]